MFSKNKATKYSIQYLATIRKPSLLRTVLKESPDSVIKAICNAALNAERGYVKLSKNKRNIFRRYSKQIRVLTSNRVPLAHKRRVIQVGGSFLSAIPLILTTVLTSIGSAFASRQ